MNEQMIELYKQAQEFAYKNISKESWNTDNFHAVVSGKFAEMIVRDVVEQIITRERTDGEWYQDDIFKHFGVEE